MKNYQKVEKICDRMQKKYSEKSNEYFQVKEQYEKFSANGKIALQNVLFKNADFPAGISVPSGEVTITPARS